MSARARTLRRRSRPSIAVRLRMFWVFAVLAIVAVLALAVAVVTAPQLRVRAIDVSVPAGGPVTKAAVQTAAAIDPAANLWLIDTGAIRRRIEALPYVSVAAVHRAQFPRPTVNLDVALREPTGCVLSNHGAVTIDRSDRVLQAGCVSARLPQIDVGASAPAAPGSRLVAPDVDGLLADARLIGERIPVRLVRRDRFGGIEAVDAEGVTLKFGADDDLAHKLTLVEPVRKSAGVQRKLRAIDLRSPETPVVEFP